jgi:hypothetical protein
MRCWYALNQFVHHGDLEYCFSTAVVFCSNYLDDDRSIHDFFHSKRIQKMMKHVLFCCAKKNSTIGYFQVSVLNVNSEDLFEVLWIPTYILLPMNVISGAAAGCFALFSSCGNSSSVLSACVFLVAVSSAKFTALYNFIVG